MLLGSHLDRITHVADTVKLQPAHAAKLIERRARPALPLDPDLGPPRERIAVAGAGRTAYHGFKAIELLASALVAEAMKLATPASVFSRSTERHNQDKVPMRRMERRISLR